MIRGIRGTCEVRGIWGGALTVLSAVAWLLPLTARAADQAKLAPEDDTAPSETLAATTAPAANSPAFSGLVPLKELNRQRYAGVWLFDFRFHNVGFGLAAQTVAVDGSLRGSFYDGQVVRDVQEETSGKLQYGSLCAQYYLPLVGYTPEVSIGLVPMLRFGLGGVYSGSGTSALASRRESKLGTLIELPVFAMARVGAHASRYGAWDFSLGAGVGASFVHLSAGEPATNSAGYLAPALRVEAAYSIFQLGYEMALSTAQKSLGGSDQLSYRMQTFTLAVVLQPASDD